MGSSGDGGGGGGGGGGRVLISDKVRNTIREIREITGKKHGDEEIYAVLRDCSMDPNDAAHKLMYLDTFHDVKKRRDRKKENLKIEGRSLAIGRDNVVNHSTWRRGSRTSSMPTSQKTKQPTASLVKKASSVMPSDSRQQHMNAESNHIHVKKPVSGNAHDSEFSKNEKAASGTDKSEHRKTSNKSKVVEKNHAFEPLQSLSSSNDKGPLALDSCSDQENPIPQESIVPLKVMTSEVPTNAVEFSSELVPKSNINDDQHVTFPNHFHVPEDLKGVLVFGSFDSNRETSISFIKGSSGENNTILAVQSSQEGDGIAHELSSNPNVCSIVQEENHPEHPQPAVSALENMSSSEDGVSSGPTPKYDQSKQETLLSPEGPLKPAVNQYFLQSSLPVSPWPVPMYRQSYPPNYYSYGQYFPYFVPPVHQLLCLNGFPQQPSSGTVFLPPPVSGTATGVKSSLPQKPGINVPNPIHGVPSGYASYSSSQIGYGPSPPLTSGGSNGSGENLAPSQSKENDIYATEQMSKGSFAWFTALGQEISNLPPQSQCAVFVPTQADHGAYAGLYETAHTMASLSTMYPLMQQSQTVAGAVENVVPQSGIYLHPQHIQNNRNTKV